MLTYEKEEGQRRETTGGDEKKRETTHLVDRAANGNSGVVRLSNVGRVRTKVGRDVGRECVLNRPRLERDGGDGGEGGKDGEGTREGEGGDHRAKEEGRKRKRDEEERGKEAVDQGKSTKRRRPPRSAHLVQCLAFRRLNDLFLLTRPSFPLAISTTLRLPST
jgi:hypothetical protein